MVKKDGFEFQKSSRKHKKYMVRVNNKLVHFGERSMQHYKDKIGLYKHLDHGDKERRKRYRTRHGAIKLKDGSLAYKNKNSPSYFSWRYLW